MSDVPVQYPNSLLALLAQNSKIDIDSNDPACARQYNDSARQLHNQGTDGMTDFVSLFGDMTSNQIIVLAIARQLQDSKKQDSNVMADSVRVATELLSGHADDAEALCLGKGGLGGETEEGKLEQLVVDVFTVKVGLLMLPNLQPTGHLLAQTNPSQAYLTASTVSHARRFVALYQLLSNGEVTSNRVVIKVPSTVPGLKAMRALRGYGVQCLGTAIFCVEQGLAAAESAKVTHISPYIHPLESHFYDIEGVPMENRRVDSTYIARSIATTRCLQRLLRSPSRREKHGFTTLVKAASFRHISECVRLAGVDELTLMPSIIGELARTGRDDVDSNSGKKWEEIVQESRDGLRLDSPEKTEDIYSIEGPDWLDDVPKDQPTGFKSTRLRDALADQETSRVLEDALARFMEAENELKKMARTAIQRFREI